jgi:Rps23 Pro-64 3,4-dihydroxylase Tpa1-like proline 4-hydroxylase
MVSIDLAEVKDKFIKNGYCYFSIDLIDLDFYNYLKSNLICNETKNLKDIFYQFRFDSAELQTRFRSKTDSHLEAEIEKQRLYDESTCGNERISQIWYLNQDFNNTNSNINKKTLNTIKNGLNKVVNFFYDFTDDIEIIHPEIQFSYYNKNCRFTPHHDSLETGNICAILIYLNENYDSNNGGLLILGDEKINPIFGRCAIMDLTKHDIRHGVTEVISGDGRYAILSFPKIKKIV